MSSEPTKPPLQPPVEVDTRPWSAELLADELQAWLDEYTQPSDADDRICEIFAGRIRRWRDLANEVAKR